MPSVTPSTMLCNERQSSTASGRPHLALASDSLDHVPYSIPVVNWTDIMAIQKSEGMNVGVSRCSSLII